MAGLRQQPIIRKTRGCTVRSSHRRSAPARRKHSGMLAICVLPPLYRAHARSLRRSKTQLCKLSSVIIRLASRSMAMIGFQIGVSLSSVIIRLTSRSMAFICFQSGAASEVATLHVCHQMLHACHRWYTIESLPRQFVKILTVGCVTRHRCVQGPLLALLTL